jgi:hypothetical protein
LPGADFNGTHDDIDEVIIVGVDGEQLAAGFGSDEIVDAVHSHFQARLGFVFRRDEQHFVFNDVG